MGWLFVKKHPAIVEAGKKLNYDDLANDSTITFQKKLGNDDDGDDNNDTDNDDNNLCIIDTQN
jgi:hypothetical protein